ncbi:hypothetical protein DID76_02260 [Candidatus Marinamargulisbacteria bacterium SCGC AG-414-C22]|nr:hypothetical protein DID76_02260 [Candidatus Marinamargulisbacteria bacterium SCGC AG-414-C22]
MLKRVFKNFKQLTILDRYIIKEIVNPFALAVGGFAVIGLVDILFVLVEIFVSSNISFLILLRLLAYKLPGVIVLFFPMAVLFAVMLLFVRMAKDNELSVLRTSGVNAFRIILPAIILCILISLLSFFINENIVPAANIASDNLIRKELRKSPLPQIKRNTVFKDKNRFFYIKDIDTKNNQMKSILIFEQKRDFPRIITAATASFHEFKWVLRDGVIQEFNDEGFLDYTSNFDEMIITVQQTLRSYFKNKKKPKEMDSKELKKEIMNLEKGGQNTAALKVEYHLKHSLPAMCAVFALVGLAYCLSFVKTGKDWWGVILAICSSVLTVGFYFFLTALFRAYAKEALFPALLGAWMPNIIYGVIASSLIYYQCKHR